MINIKKCNFFIPVKKILLCIIILAATGCAAGNKNVLPKSINNENSYPMTGNASIPDTIQNAENSPQMTAEEYERLGDSFLKRGKLYTAFTQYERSLQIDSENLSVEYKKGLVLLLAKKYDDAIKQFKTVLNQDTEHALAYQGLGTAYFKKKDYINGEENLIQSIEINSNLWEARNLLGNIYDCQQKHDMAIREYKKAIKLNPDVGYLYNNLGVSYTLYGEYENAIQAFERALKRKYTKMKVYNNLGIALSKLKRYEEAFDVFKKSLGEAQAYNNLGCIYMEVGKHREATRCFEKAIESNPKFYTKASDNLKKLKASLDYENRIHPTSS